jgi:hypothetical protein
LYLHRKKNELITAENLLHKALRAKSTVFGPNHGHALKTKCNLALVSFLKDRDSGQFELLLSSNLDGLMELWGEKDVDTVAVAKQLISLYFVTENSQAGHQLCRDLNIERNDITFFVFS